MVSTNELAIAVGMLGAFLAGHVLRDAHGESSLLQQDRPCVIRLLPCWTIDHSYNERERPRLAMLDLLELEGWRIMFGLSSLMAVLQLLGMAFMPLSPRWLITKGRGSEALAVLLKIRNSQVTIGMSNSVILIVEASRRWH